ncbi:hypothetical protein [Palleronia abyssalis]|uniref:FG-GAP repeat protein n=1 Tax=Palleronia abyssalis TaxID=1501240 RepID=A0A2R8BXL1_9RHOB|nr:hypothetical protein [Palleronia abyssalis]SPJ24816.1 hypothetical protein PAA8504_02655 [Palleronia abyssalis]
MLRVAVCLIWLAGTAAADVVSAGYTGPTTRYDHGVLGDAVEWGALEMRTSDGRLVTVTLPETRVFEDTAPRLSDLDGDGAAEVIAVETDLRLGARLSIYDESGLVAATEFIGQTHAGWPLRGPPIWMGTAGSNWPMWTDLIWFGG